MNSRDLKLRACRAEQRTGKTETLQVAATGPVGTTVSSDPNECHCEGVDPASDF